MILHMDIDAFFAAVEQARNPALRGRPVIVGNGCIASCSYEARRFGLSAGMSLSEARRRCPEVVILDGSEKVYRCYGERIFALCRQLTPAVEAHLDEAYLDLYGMERHYPDPLAVGEALRRRIREQTGLAATVGIGRNRMFARLATAAAKPDGLGIVPASAEQDVLDALPVEKLPGVGWRTAKTLAEVNVTTVAGLRALSREVLRGLFGRNGELLYDRARGVDVRRVGGAVGGCGVREIPRQISRATTFHRPTSDGAEIEGMLCYLAERATRAAREQSLAARTIKVAVRYQDGPSSGMQRTVPPTDLDDAVQAVALDLLSRVFTRRVDVRLVGVTLSRFVPGQRRQLQLFQPEEEERQIALTDAIDKLRTKYGHAVLVGGRSIHLLGQLEQETHGFVLRTPSLTK